MRWLTFADSIPKSKQMSTSKDHVTTSTVETHTAHWSLASRSTHRSSGITYTSGRLASRPINRSFGSTFSTSLIWHHVLHIGRLASRPINRSFGSTFSTSLIWHHVLHIGRLASR
eukprot:728381_1